MSRMAFDFCVPASHPSLPGHFPGQAIVPGVLLLDHVLQAVRRLTGRDLRSLQQVKFLSALLPDETAHGWCEIDGERIRFRVTVQRGDTVVTLAEGAGTALPA